MFNLLSLTGGGALGLYSAGAIRQLETYMRSGDIRTCVDAYAGTSAGSIIAAGLAVGRTPQQIFEFFEENIEQIFLARGRGPGKHSSRYKEHNLRAKLDEEFYGKTLSDVEKPLVITAVDASTYRPIIFSSFGVTAPNTQLYYESAPLADAVLASCSAPTYFPMLRHSFLQDDDYNPGSEGLAVDGGLIANAPDLLAATECMFMLGERLESMRILSIGTALPNRKYQKSQRLKTRFKWGGWQWVLRNKGPLFDIVFGGQVNLTAHLAERLLGQDRYVRIDILPAHMERPEIDSIEEILSNCSAGQEYVANYFENEMVDPYRLHLFLDRH